MSAVEQILRIVSVLHPHGPQLPGKPPASKRATRVARQDRAIRSMRLVPVTNSLGQVIGHSRAACGAVQTQTRVTKLNTFSPIDIAAQIGMAGLDDEQRWMLEWIAGDDRKLPLLQITLASTLAAQATFAKWTLKSGEAEKLAALSLQMLVDSDACTSCNTSGIGVSDDGKIGVCSSCNGVGHVSLSDAAIARLLRMPRETYRRRLSHVVNWAQALLQGYAETILDRIRGN